MTRPLDSKKIEGLIRRIETGLAQLPEYDPFQDDDEHFERQQQALETLAFGIAREGGGKIGGNAVGARTLRMAGIATSCTSGFAGLLRNWAARARKEIGAA